MTFEFFAQMVPEMRVRFNESGDIRQVFDSLALSPLGGIPGLDFTLQGTRVSPDGPCSET
jgi:hypothetical protein